MFLLFLFFFFSSLPLQAQWYQYRSDDGSFEVSMPQMPEISNNLVVGSMGKLDFQVLTNAISKQEFVVRFAKLQIPDRNPTDVVVERIQETLSNLGADLVSANEIGTSSGAAHQFLASLPDGTSLKGRVFSHSGVLVELWFKTDRAQISHPDGNKFLESFRWKRLLDADLESKLSEMGLEYRIDEEGDYEIAVNFEEENRHQICYLSPFHDAFTDEIRVELWSPIHMYNGVIPESVANILLNENGSSSSGYFGSLSYDNGQVLLIYTHIFPLETTSELMYDFIMDTLIISDNMEAEVSDVDNF